MKVLGLTDGVFAGAAWVEEGKTLAAISEERLCRLKMARGFPRESIGKVVSLAGRDLRQVDEVAVASTHEFFCDEVVPWKGWFQGDRGLASEAFRGVSSQLVRLVGSSRPFQRVYYGLKSRLTAGRAKAITRIFREEFGYEGRVAFHDHHLCHGWTAYGASGFEDCLVFTLDGGGDGQCSRIYLAQDGRLQLLASVPAYDSIGNFYAYVTHLLGFKAHRDEGKISGLAAHGKPIFRDHLLSLISHREGTLRNHRRIYYHSALATLQKVLPDRFAPEDLACSIQSVLETEVTQLVAHWLRKTGRPRLALAGGVFANVRLNQSLLELPEVDSLYVFPAMGDDGLAVGAALAAEAEAGIRRGRGQGLALHPWEHAFLGPGLDEKKIGPLLEASGVPFRKPRGGDEEEIVDLLARGEVVAVCRGPMEFGPRALGHRSILYRPDDPSLQVWLNDRLRRTEFMPFAPATTRELARECFYGLEGAERAARFMTITFPCRESFREKCSGVVHIDGTARPQIVDRETDPRFHEVIERFHERTGLPALVNTSFNLHEEPIVHSVEDALRAWREVGILHLFVGPYVVPAAKARGPEEGRTVPSGASH